jgi:hypothetical protein
VHKKQDRPECDGVDEVKQAKRQEKFVSLAKKQQDRI